MSTAAQVYPGAMAGGGLPVGGGHAQALTEEPEHGPSKRIVVAYGFWIFLISDIILFSALFASYAVLTDATAGGPSGRDLFELPTVAIETACLLLSTVFCGIAGIGAQARKNVMYYGAMAATFVLGATFVAIELHEFTTMIQAGAGPGRSAFLSAFFALIGCHGLHVSAGLLWLLTMMAQVYAKGYRADIQRRLLLLRALLAHPRHHLGGPVQSGLPGWSGTAMSTSKHEAHGDLAPGDDLDPGDIRHAIGGYLVGLALATLLTCVSFYIAQSTLVWQPSIPIALSVLALAQMGVHLVFFLHITSGPDSVNNVMALAFGLLIVVLLVFGSLWIMTHLDHNVMPMERMMQMQR